MVIGYSFQVTESVIYMTRQEQKRSIFSALSAIRNMTNLITKNKNFCTTHLATEKRQILHTH